MVVNPEGRGPYLEFDLNEFSLPNMVTLLKGILNSGMQT